MPQVDKSKMCELDEKTKRTFLKKGYSVDTMLGAGSFGQVYKGVRVATGELCAVKMMDLQKMSNRFKNKFLPRELASLMEIKHENIIRVWDIFRSNRKIYVFMVMLCFTKSIHLFLSIVSISRKHRCTISEVICEVIFETVQY